MSTQSSLEEKIWHLVELERAPRMSELRAIVTELREVLEAETDNARQEGWSDGYFEGGGLSG